MSVQFKHTPLMKSIDKDTIANDDVESSDVTVQAPTVEDVKYIERLAD